jgi:hypothetical protein
MANVYEGKPDERQSARVDEPVSRFRPVYRALTDDEKALHDNLKSAYRQIEELIEQIPPGRYRSLAITALEESCMWAVKELTANR